MMRIRVWHWMLAILAVNALLWSGIILSVMRIASWF